MGRQYSDSESSSPVSMPDTSSVEFSEETILKNQELLEKRQN